MVIFTKKFGTLDPHQSSTIVWDKVPKKRFFDTFPYTVSPNYFTSQEQGEMQGVNFIPAACSLMERKECYASASFFTTEQSGATE